MNKSSSSERGPTEEAMLFAADCLRGPDRWEFENLTLLFPWLADEARELRGAFHALAETAPPQLPPDGLKDRLMARVSQQAKQAEKQDQEVQIWKSWPQSAEGTFSVISGEDLPWQPTAFPGVEAKNLFVDRELGRVTMLVRMGPESAYPNHRHGGPEECFVLEGDLHGPGFSMKKGDYQRAEADSQHGIQYTREGCLLLISSSLDDQLEPMPS